MDTDAGGLQNFRKQSFWTKNDVDPMAFRRQSSDHVRFRTIHVTGYK